MKRYEPAKISKVNEYFFYILGCMIWPISSAFFYNRFFTRNIYLTRKKLYKRIKKRDIGLPIYDSINRTYTWRIDNYKLVYTGLVLESYDDQNNRVLDHHNYIHDIGCRMRDEKICDILDEIIMTRGCRL